MIWFFESSVVVVLGLGMYFFPILAEGKFIYNGAAPMCNITKIKSHFKNYRNWSNVCN